MRVFTGPDDRQERYAAVWFAHPAWSKDGRHIDARYIWSALDCPSSGPAFANALDPDADSAYVLGTFDVRIVERPAVGAHYTVTCTLDSEHEKVTRTRVSLYSAKTRLLATGAATWVRVPRALFGGA